MYMCCGNDHLSRPRKQKYQLAALPKRLGNLFLYDPYKNAANHASVLCVCVCVLHQGLFDFCPLALPHPSALFFFEDITVCSMLAVCVCRFVDAFRQSLLLPLFVFLSAHPLVIVAEGAGLVPEPVELAIVFL